MLLTAAMALSTCILSCASNKTPETAEHPVVQTDTVKTIIIEVREGDGDSIKYDGGFSWDDSFQLKPGQIVIIKADYDVPMGRITDIKEKLNKVDGVRIRYQLNGSEPADSENYEFPLVPTVEEENGTFIYPIDRENNVPVRINAAGSLLVDGGKAPYGILCKPGEDLSPSREAFANAIRNNHNINFFILKDRATPFGIFHSVIGHLNEAYEQVRNEYSYSTFGKPLKDLTEPELQTVLTQIPRHINMGKDLVGRRDTPQN